MAVSGGSERFVAPGDHGRSFKGRGRFGGSLGLFGEEGKMNEKTNMTMTIKQRKYNK